MLTSTFIQKEPIQVTTPSSVSEIKIPETNLLTIMVDSKGKIFMSLDNQKDMISTLKAVGEDYGIEFTKPQLNSFQKQTSFGVPIRSMADFLDLPAEEQDKYMKEVESQRVGIPTETAEVKDVKGIISADNEFKRWVGHATEINPLLQIAIKADKLTEYPVVKKVMDDMREMHKNRYLLITSLKTASSE
jgi:biopolymer transport protein ExbD